ncbi:hypothetical protein AT52_00216 [Streptococcus equi subsp. zooepidemicus Sz35]|uniref:Uncharacterized protein n=1 Tax=Streptococcus equi subsp. zooepidemicus TaxID=40041 RepID=A0A7Z8ZVP4_STRSZ|nr:hypothetical protein AT52_00216 [Streptococcus equi subsp. zooepidemicus Sz35]VEF07980.1 Uncharacterised protein [Streptococcus equi subsp. zooepidemicus]
MFKIAELTEVDSAILDLILILVTIINMKS